MPFNNIITTISRYKRTDCGGRMRPKKLDFASCLYFLLVVLLANNGESSFPHFRNTPPLTNLLSSSLTPQTQSMSSPISMNVRTKDQPPLTNSQPLQTKEKKLKTIILLPQSKANFHRSLKKLESSDFTNDEVSAPYPFYTMTKHAPNNEGARDDISNSTYSGSHRRVRDNGNLRHDRANHIFGESGKDRSMMEKALKSLSPGQGDLVTTNLTLVRYVEFDPNPSQQPRSPESQLKHGDVAAYKNLPWENIGKVKVAKDYDNANSLPKTSSTESTHKRQHQQHIFHSTSQTTQREPEKLQTQSLQGYRNDDISEKKVFKRDSPLTHTQNFMANRDSTEVFANWNISTANNNSTLTNCTELNLRKCMGSESGNMTDSEDSSQMDRHQLEQKFKESHSIELWTSLGFFDDAYLASINSHWLQFEPADPHVHKILAFCYTVICFVGCGGNLLVIIMCIGCPSLRTPPIYLVMNLALSDFLMIAKMPVFIYNSYYEGPALGAMGCQIYGFLGGLTGTCSIMTLAAISLDRYYVIGFPFNPLKRTNASRAFCMVAFVWIYSFVFSSLPLFGINAYVSEGYLTSCSFEYLSPKVGDRVFVLVFFVAAYIIPLIVIVFSYVNIFLIVRSAEQLQFSGGSSGESFKIKHDKKKQKSEVKIALLSFIIILVWTLAWTPYAIVALLGIFGYHHLITPLISAVPALFCKTASCIDPFIYAINHPKFQRELKNKCPCCSRTHHPSLDRGLSNTASAQRANSDQENVTVMERATSIKKSISGNSPKKGCGTGKQVTGATNNNAQTVRGSMRKSFAPSTAEQSDKLEKLNQKFPSGLKNVTHINSISGTNPSSNQHCTTSFCKYEINEVQIVSHKDGESHINLEQENREKVLICTQILSNDEQGPVIPEIRDSCGESSSVLQGRSDSIEKNVDRTELVNCTYSTSSCESAENETYLKSDDTTNVTMCDYLELKNIPEKKDSSQSESCQMSHPGTSQSPNEESMEMSVMNSDKPSKKMLNTAASTEEQQDDKESFKQFPEKVDKKVANLVKLETLIM